MSATQLPLVPGIAPQPQRDRSWLREAREIAAAIAHERGSVTAEDVVARMRPPEHPNQIGGILCSPWFVKSRHVPSRHPAAHGRGVWGWLLTPTGREAFLGY